MTGRTTTALKALSTLAGGLVLAGCVATPVVDPDGALTDLPEPLLALAAPYQNLDKVRLDPADNCFWYLHDGPVEQTWLPLRTPRGNPICQPEPEPAPPDPA